MGPWRLLQDRAGKAGKSPPCPQCGKGERQSVHASKCRPCVHCGEGGGRAESGRDACAVHKRELQQCRFAQDVTECELLLNFFHCCCC